jgi:hypothetical protein
LFYDRGDLYHGHDYTCLNLQRPSCVFSPTITSNHGSLTAAPSKALYDEGEKVSVIPVPDMGYRLTDWFGDERKRQGSASLGRQSDDIRTDVDEELKLEEELP